ncbi:hypothetical protein HMPREF1979_02542 [Actinomyces johnsonii F0542]|uniref:Uncharacterized protein n=1 Tax=Actinomyces johnsonii F0542 TaxID=1321818 RepID=U1Q3C1_9ACTO|nr:hypothetical protein HMPREF1979_02542 [Actinomyces johnsonii F0542]
MGRSLVFLPVWCSVPLVLHMGLAVMRWYIGPITLLGPNVSVSDGDL